MKFSPIIIIIILLPIVIWVMTDFFNIIFRGFAPLVFSRKSTIDPILNIIKPKPRQVIYKLGSGNAKFLRMAEKKFPEVKLIGLEYSIIPFLFFSLILRLKKSKIKIHLQNIFRADLREADFIYCYLFPAMMPELSVKVRSECKPGTILISNMFSIPDWEPKQIIKQNNGTIYFYEV